jgi:hypothetical protein
MGVESIRGVVEAAIQRASAATGVDFTFLLGAAGRESSLNPSARARTSSAAGLFQFVDQTWLSTLKKHGAKYGYARYAEMIQQTADGRYYVNGSEARQTVMDLRLDPHAASLMAGELASDHASYLRGRVGRDPTSGELYAAHVLGGPGSAKLIEAVSATPAAPAAALFPEAAGANRGLFYRDGRALSVAEVYDNLTRPASPSGGRAPVETAASSASTTDGFLQYASARRLDRATQEQALVDLVLRGPQSPGGGDGMSDLAGQVFSSDMLRVLSEAREDAGSKLQRRS